MGQLTQTQSLSSFAPNWVSNGLTFSNDVRFPRQSFSIELQYFEYFFSRVTVSQQNTYFNVDHTVHGVVHIISTFLVFPDL